jgi:stalled ribosome alternative rescue factor ArfA
MSTMFRERSEQSSNGRGVETRAHAKRSGPADSNQAFLHAFADALRDILREERRAAA